MHRGFNHTRIAKKYGECDVLTAWENRKIFMLQPGFEHSTYQLGHRD